MSEFRKLKSLKFLYEINREGVLRNIKSKKIVKGSIERNGYVRVKIENKCLDGIIRTTIHRLVAEAFVPNPQNKPFVNHKDFNRSNNRADNLEWVTHSENMKHAYENGSTTELLKRIHERNKKKVICVEKNKIFSSVSEAAEWLVSNNLCKNKKSGISGVHSVASKKRKTFGKFKWEYI